MAYCDNCGNYNSEHEYDNSKPMEGLPDDSLYFYWDYPLEENYDWRGAEPECDCLCEICFDILNSEGKIKWKCAS